MRKLNALAVLLFALFAIGSLHAQNGTGAVLNGRAAPTGPCIGSNSIFVNIAAGTAYACHNRVWAQLGANAGTVTAVAGTANQVTCTGSASVTCGLAPAITLPGTIAPLSGKVLISNSGPSVLAAGCGGAAAAIATSSDTAAFKVNVGTSNTGTCTITMPAATTDWLCTATDTTTTSTAVSVTKSIPTAGHLTTEITLQNYTDISGAGAWTDNDVIAVQCSGE